MSAKPVSSPDAHVAPQPFFKASFSLHGPVAHTADDALPRILDRGGAQREKLANGCLFGQTNQPSLSKSQLKRKKRKARRQLLYDITGLLSPCICTSTRRPKLSGAFVQEKETAAQKM